MGAALKGKAPKDRHFRTDGTNEQVPLGSLALTEFASEPRYRLTERHLDEVVGQFPHIRIELFDPLRRVYVPYLPKSPFLSRDTRASSPA